MSKANEALDRMAENAKELGLDYEPAQQEPVQETLQQQLEKAKTALYNARADTRRIQQIIMRQS